MNRKALALVMAGVLSASAVIPAFAEETNGVRLAEDGTEIWAGILVDDPDARIKVEVPTLFAFVVNGTVTKTAADAVSVSSENGNILLPNAKVNVITQSAGSNVAVYELDRTGSGIMQMKNYSTKKVTKTSENTGRTGLEVEVNGNIKNEGTDVERNNWEYVGALSTTVDTDEFKKYMISIDSGNGAKWLSESVDGGYELKADERITLGAPVNVDTTNVDTATNLALNPTVKTLTFGVKAGGQRAQYNQIEQSAKVGTIVWTVSAEVTTTDDVKTAPAQPYLDVDTATNIYTAP